MLEKYVLRGYRKHHINTSNKINGVLQSLSDGRKKGGGDAGNRNTNRYVPEGESMGIEHGDNQEFFDFKHRRSQQCRTPSLDKDEDCVGMGRNGVRNS